MAKVQNMVIENDLHIEKREISIYHHSRTRTYIISHGNAVKIPLSSNAEMDYLHISLVRGPGVLQSDCFIYLPDWIDFDFSDSNLNGTFFFKHSSGRIFLKIPPGFPNWELKVFNHNDQKSPQGLKVDQIVLCDILPIFTNNH